MEITETTRLRDTRGLFSNLTTRKPRMWRDLPIRYNSSHLTDRQHEALRSLPVVPVRGHPLEDLVDDENLMEFVAKVGERTFYVNTEGFKYARHTFEFHPKVLNPASKHCSHLELDLNA